MPSLFRQILGNLEERLDEDLLPALYAAVSLPADEVRRELEEQGLAYRDPVCGLEPGLEELDASAARIVARSRGRASAIGAAGALGGAVSVPPEVLAGLVHTLRLGQRLAVVYGVDPESERGKVLLWRAVGAAYDLELPDQGTLDLRVRDLPTAFSRQLPQGQRHAAAWMTRHLVLRSLRQATRRVTRLVPGLDVGLSVWSSRRRAASQGERMQAVFRAAWDGDSLQGDVEEAEVVA